jgi:hypothetical protein
MDFLYRNAIPGYKGTQPQPQVKNGPLSGLFCNLLGGGTPSYKTLDARGAQASTQPRCWWQAFVTTPSYKTAPRPADWSESSSTPDDCREAEADQGCECEPTQVVIL